MNLSLAESALLGWLIFTVGTFVAMHGYVRWLRQEGLLP